MFRTCGINQPYGECTQIVVQILRRRQFETASVNMEVRTCGFPGHQFERHFASKQNFVGHYFELDF